MVFKMVKFIIFTYIVFLFPIEPYANELDEVKQLLNDKYYRPLSEEEQNSSSLEILFSLLDPYSDYMTIEEHHQSLLKMNNSSLYGIGIELKKINTEIIVSRVFGEGPSQGLLEKGDIINEIDNIKVFKKSTNAVRDILKRNKEKVKIKIYRKTENKYYIYEIKKAKFEISSVTASELSNNILYIKIDKFNHNTIYEVEQMVKKHSKRQWIIDLRNNPGGYVEAAQEFLGFFDGVGVAFIYKDRWATKKLPVIEQNNKIEGEVVVLIDNKTASASEIVAGTLQHYSIAKIIGGKSFGKGLMQNIYFSTSGNIFKVSVGEFLTPGNKVIQNTGINPDISSYNPEKTAYNYLVFKFLLIKIIIQFSILAFGFYFFNLYYKNSTYNKFVSYLN